MPRAKTLPVHPRNWETTCGNTRIDSQGMREDVRLIFLPRQRIFDYQWGRQPGQEMPLPGVHRDNCCGRAGCALVSWAGVRRCADQSPATDHLQNRGNPLDSRRRPNVRRTLMLDADPACRDLIGHLTTCSLSLSPIRRTFGFVFR